MFHFVLERGENEELSFNLRCFWIIAESPVKLTKQLEKKIREGRTECALEGSVEGDSSWGEESPNIQAGASPPVHKVGGYPHLLFSGKPGHF